MGLVAPVDSDPITAEVDGDMDRKESQGTKDSQTASEYVSRSLIATSSSCGSDFLLS
jgi:hypothetical protein